MTQFDKSLITDEHIIYLTKKHVIIFALPIFFLVATLYCYFSTNASLVNIAFAPGIATILITAQRLLAYFTSEFAITNKRILMSEGFFFRHSNELRLATVSNITINQSLLGRVLNYGNLIINPFGGKNDIFNDVAGPVEFQRQTQMQLDKLVK